MGHGNLRMAGCGGPSGNVQKGICQRTIRPFPFAAAAAGRVSLALVTDVPLQP